MKQKFWLFATFVISLLLLPVLITSAQSSSAESPQNATLRGDIVGVLLPSDADATGAINVIDYGNFQWAIFPASSRVAQRSDATDYSLWLGGDTIYTDSAAKNEQNWGTARTNEKNLHLVQMIAPIKAEWRGAIEATGLEIVQYIYPFTYVVYGSQTAMEQVSSAEFVRWQHNFDTGFRVLPHYRTVTSRAAQPHRLVIYRGADIDAISAELATLSGNAVQFTTLNETWAVTNINLTTETLTQAAQLSGIFTIQPLATDGGLRGEMSNQFIVRNLDGAGVIQAGYAAWLTAVGVNGNGVIVADVDGGVQDDHPNLISRLLACTGSTCGGAATDSHGTHTAGIIAADGSSNVMLNGFQRGLGVAPGANLIEQINYPTYTHAGGMLTLMRQSVQNNAVISANSWGPSGSPQGYDNDTLQADIGVRDADSTTAGNQPLTYVLSFMNGFGGISTQGTPDEAKNLFTIGSTNMQTGAGTQHSSLFSLSANSAHGPALDGRIIPHMVAPGCVVDSTVSISAYGFKCGTSMASPHVSGGAALFFEKYRIDQGSDPSPAMVKAAFSVIADSLVGNNDADGVTLGNPFDNQQGWGAFNLAEVISPTHPILYIDQTHLFTQTGQTYSITVKAVVPDQPVRIMLVWTDAPGHGLGGNTPAWNNNLDLIAAYNGSDYAGNQFATDGWSQASTTFDTQNNTEAIFFASIGDTELISLTVAANAINSDGVPSNGTATDQDFALVCYNCELDPGSITAVSLDLQKTHTPTSSLPGILAVGLAVGSIVTYTITRTVNVTGSYQMDSSLVDTGATGLTVLPETIRVNGQLQPALYDAMSGEIQLSQSAESISSTNTLVLTYQSRVNNEQPTSTQITNTVNTEVTINGTIESAEASTMLTRLKALFLPLIFR